ncbi:MAG: MFS transporter [Microbacteriaceae bacterium]
MNSKRAWLVVSVSVFAYMIAVLQRTSLGVVGIDATERFGVQAALLSTLAVVQLIVYAGLQIPVGVILDRIGPRLLIGCGAALMCLGQLTLAFAPEIGVAIVGRILVGAGDAMTFISVSRLIAAWFSGRALPLLTQAMGTVGQFGQVLSAVPLLFVLHQFGWPTAFVSVSAISLVVVILVFAIVRNGPVYADGSAPRTGQLDAAAIAAGHGTWRGALRQLRESLARPGTQLGFWSHFVTQSSGTVFTLLWGFPFLTAGLGYDPGTASLMLGLVVVTAVVCGPILGILSARYPYRRSTIVLAIVASMGIAWTAVLAWPGTPPVWLVITLIVVIAIGGPGSLIGFDFARTFNPARSLGSASGVVNVGGFLASFVMMFLIGLVLDLVDRANGGSGIPSQLYSLDSFRLAFLVQFPVVGVGVVFLLITRGRTRRQLHAEEGIQVAPLWVALVRGWRKRA